MPADPGWGTHRPGWAGGRVHEQRAGDHTGDQCPDHGQEDYAERADHHAGVNRGPDVSDRSSMAITRQVGHGQSGTCVVRRHHRQR